MIKAVVFDMFETLVTHYRCPQYFGEDIAKDLNIDSNIFLDYWNSFEDDRTLGKINLENALRTILQQNNIFSEKLLNQIVEKRKNIKRMCFQNISDEIMKVLDYLKENGIKIGLISNCFSEEAEVIKESELYKYFSVCCLSYDMGIKKPDMRIFDECLNMLGVQKCECLYIGDGGSKELEASSTFGMRTFQATWFINEKSKQSKIKDGYRHLKNPLEIIEIIEAEK
ncbi:MAG: HAD family hydrolase [Lachnospiraceae bacterium]|nr:HAD family hydrolase [Lachnospiraceae bacterium]